MAEGTPTLAPPSSGVTVRLYRPDGIGDCFLLAFRAADGGARYMLIDCGVLPATKGGSARLKKIASDIAAATGGHLHVLVATHEHFDHLSGFQYARRIFDEIQVDEVWMGWTEDPTHPLGRRLREGRAQALRALGAAVTRLKASDGLEATSIESVLDFYGGLDAVLGISSTAGQLEYVRGRAEPPRYCRPGEPPLSLPDVDGVRIYVLGPPEDEALLSRSDPSIQDSEVYERALAIDQATSLYIAALAAAGAGGLSADQRGLLESSQPFDITAGIPLDRAGDDGTYGRFFRERYGFASGVEDEGLAWRRIEADWLRAAGQLALDLDEDTNNTSLALAIELTRSGQVLLFPADAQVGNWLSWHNLSWSQPGAREDKVVTGGDLIRRTVFYKVGHHGSHNATLREKGLEMMSNPDLVAMIPVDEEQAATRGTMGWSMPFPPLEERLHQKTMGRIIRSDTGVPARPPSSPPAEWRTFQAHIDVDQGRDKLWIQYTVTE